MDPTDGLVAPLESRRSGGDLPHEPADRFTRPFRRFLRIEAASGLLLLLAVMAALGLANSPWSTAYLAFWEKPLEIRFGSLDFGRSLRHWINDGLMAVFFFVVALELKREFVLGELRSLRVAALPFAGALGGMIVPVSFYLAVMAGKPGAQGWGTVMATDTAFVIGCLALFGSRIPASLRLFLLSLVIFDDVGAILVVAVGYSGSLDWLALALAAFGLVGVAGSARLGVRFVPAYVVLGVVVWLCFDASGIHPTLAGVVLGSMTPTRVWITDARLRMILGRVLSKPTGGQPSGDSSERRDLRRAGVAVRESLSPVERLEMMLHPWAGFAIMPLFALANAGVVISVENFGRPVVTAIVTGLVLGKPIGVFFFGWAAVRFGLATRAPSLTWPLMAAGALLTGIAFTMSLFIAGLTFPPAMLDAAKLGILAGSIGSTAAGLAALAWLTSPGRAA